MSKSKIGRSIKTKDGSEVSSNTYSRPSVPTALLKIFHISQHMLNDKTETLNLERFYHPGKGQLALFITKDNKHLMEVLEFSEPRRCWLIDNEVCSNGHIYFTTPIDVTFLALYHLHKHCLQRALALDSIHDEEDSTVARILNNFVDPKNLNCIADVKTVDGNKCFYKYNHNKAMAWLSLKAKRVAKALQTNELYCGNSAVSHNFARSEKAINETTKDTDYLRMACDYVGGYISLDLYEELNKRLNIPSEIQAITEEKKATNKRKSTDKLNENVKKQKLGNETSTNLKDNPNLLDVSLHEEEENKEINTNSASAVATKPLKERSLSTKEKSLAKSAKGTKSIASFFTKKTI